MQKETNQPKSETKKRSSKQVFIYLFYFLGFIAAVKYGGKIIFQSPLGKIELDLKKKVEEKVTQFKEKITEVERKEEKVSQAIISTNHKKDLFQLKKELMEMEHALQGKIDMGELLYQEFDKLKNMTEAEKERFLEEVSLFLGEDTPSFKGPVTSFGIVETMKYYAGKMDSLQAEADVLQGQIEQERSQSDTQTETNNRLRAELASVQQELNSSLQAMEEIKAAAAQQQDENVQLRRENERLQGQIAGLEEESDSLEVLLEEAKVTIASTDEFKIERATFEPLDTKKRRKGNYKFGHLNKLALQFRLAPTYPTKKDSVKLLFVFQIRKDAGFTMQEIKFEREVPIGKKQKIIIDENFTDLNSRSLKFVPGIYYAQVIYQSGEEELPLLVGHFEVRKWLKQSGK